MVIYARAIHDASEFCERSFKIGHFQNTKMEEHLRYRLRRDLMQEGSR